MAIARVACAVSIRVELFDIGDTPDGRDAAEKKRLTAANAGDGGDTPKLDDEDAGTANGGRPYFVIASVLPISWSASFNSFRLPDKFECEIPLELLPVPPDAIRAISCQASIRHLDADAWQALVVEGASPEDVGLSTDITKADFAGVCALEGIAISGGAVPSVKLPFVDFVGLLAQMHPNEGAHLSEDEPISQAVAEFLATSPATKGLDVSWVDPDYPEPTVGKYVPKTTKHRKGSSARKQTHAKQTYLDAIVEECSKVGVVPRVNVGRIDLAYAGTMYDGRDRGTDVKATILLGRTVEDFNAEHKLLGVGTKSIMVASYNPDTHVAYRARWPADASTLPPIEVTPGDPAIHKLAANIGLPGYEQLDESVEIVPVAPVADASILPKVAEAIFLERTRQKIRYRLQMHAPWSDPDNAIASGADVLALRAGDNVHFGVVPLEQGADLLPPAARVLSGDIGEQGIAALLRGAGVPADASAKAAAAIARLPRQSRFRVDELHVAGGAGRDPELELVLVNFTVIVSDLKAKAEGRPPAETIQRLRDNLPLLAGLSTDAVEEIFAKARDQVLDSGASDGDASSALDQLDGLQKQAMKGR